MKRDDLLSKLSDADPEARLCMESGGNVIYANPAAQSLFPGAPLEGRSWIALCPDMNAGEWDRIARSDSPVHVEIEIGARNVAFTYIRSGRGEEVFAFGTDVSPLRLAETQLAEITRFPEMNPGPELRTDLEGFVVMANAAARRIFGTAILGGTWHESCPGMSAATWRKVLSSESPVPFEARIGECEYTFAHRRDPEGDFIFVYGADITHQKRAERALHQAERMATLGTLAAGVAHELNNPAAATRRAAEQLRESFSRLEQARIAIEMSVVDPKDRAMLSSLEAQAREQGSRISDLSAIERSDRETATEEWLDERSIPDPWDLAPQLVGLGLDPPALDRLADAFPDGTLAPVLRWAACLYPVHALLHEIGQGSTRISEIVGALKNYSYLGQAPMQPVNVHDSLDNTLVILRSKLKTGITVRRDYDPALPVIQAYGSELNQVWTNLIDNAADAMGGKGSLTIRTRPEGDGVAVEIEDDGPGIPDTIQGRIFDPFFTTKEPGKGTGLGLSTTYGIITEKHRGSIRVESRPGLTRFTVTLPSRLPSRDSETDAEDEDARTSASHQTSGV